MKIFNNENLISIIILSVVFGILSGFVGGLVTRQYFPDQEYSLSSINNLNINANRGVFSKDTKNIVIEQNDRVADVLDSAKMSQVGIFKKISLKVLDQSKEDEFNLYANYIIDQPVATGLVITSDGWLVSTFSPDKMANYVAITKDKKIYDIDQAVPNTASAFVFLHINAYDLPVKKFASESEIRNGQVVLASNWRGMGWVSTIYDKNNPDNLIVSSDAWQTKIKLTENLPKDFFGSILLNYNSDIVGLVDNSGNIEPITRYQSVINNLLKNNSISRPYLGVNYINYSKLINADTAKASNIKGALLYQDNNVQAVIKGSPAETAGLLAGDIITTVDNTEITPENDLVKVIQDYVSGEKINIQYLRKGELKETTVVLGSQ